VAVLVVPEEKAGVTDPLGGRLAQEEVAIADDDPKKRLVLLVILREGLDPVQQLVVVER